MSNTKIENALVAFGLMEDRTPVKPKYLCQEDNCTGQMVNADHFPYCNVCGTMDVNSPLQHYNEADAPYIPKASLYKRRQYYLEKISLLLGRKQSSSPKYKQMIRALMTVAFDGPTELKAHMKEMGYAKFYKFLHNIYFDVRRVRLIALTAQQIDRLVTEFVQLEWKFKGSPNLHTRKNFPCYISTLHNLMKKNKIAGSKHLVLPYNHKQIVGILKRIDV